MGNSVLTLGSHCLCGIPREAKKKKHYRQYAQLKYIGLFSIPDIFIRDGIFTGEKI